MNDVVCDDTDEGHKLKHIGLTFKVFFILQVLEF